MIKPLITASLNTTEKRTRSKIKEDLTPLGSDAERIRNEKVHEKKWLCKKITKQSRNITAGK